MSSARLFIWLLLFFPKGFNCHQLREGFPDHSTQKRETLTILPYSTQPSWKIHNSFTSDLLKFICPPILVWIFLEVDPESKIYF